MTDAIKPALTPEQWAQAPKVYLREPRHVVRGPGRGGLPSHGMSDEGFGVELANDGSMWVWDDSNGASVDADRRHGLAALALHGQVFGFTRDDVEDLRWIATEFVVPGTGASVRLQGMADRIEALLPPANTAIAKTVGDIVVPTGVTQFAYVQALRDGTHVVIPKGTRSQIAYVDDVETGWYFDAEAEGGPVLTEVRPAARR